MEHKKSLVALLDTSVATRNLGDHVIMSAVRRELSELLPDSLLVSLPTHLSVGVPGYKLLRKAEFAVVGGTNLLTSNMLTNRQWKVGIADALFQRNFVLMGVGWWGYQRAPDSYTRALYRALLSSDIPQSVRDNYTRTHLIASGVAKVINTGCPTMWRLSASHCKNVPRGRGNAVVVTLTDYRPDISRDRELLTQLRASYSKVYFWPQGLNDLAYLQQVGAAEVQVIGSSLACLDAILSSDESLDYVGTRLHAGVRALQHSRRTLIVGVDNRASEISRDTGLRVIPSDAVGRLTDELKSNWATNLSLPWSEIERWRAEVQRYAR